MRPSLVRRRRAPHRAAVAVAASALLLITGTACGARFPRQTVTAGGVVAQPGVPAAPDDGLGGQPGVPLPPGATTAPPPGGFTPGPAGPGQPTSGPRQGPGQPSQRPSQQPTQGPGQPQSVDPGRRTGVTATSITIGYLIPKTGAAQVPPQVEQGINVYWRYLNDRGGIFGRKIQTIVADTESNESVARSRAQQLIDQGVFMVAALDRLGVQKAIGEYLDARQVPNVEVQTPANLNARQAWTFGITIDHAVQGGVIARYFKNVLKVAKAAVIYERDATLQPGVDNFKAEAGRQGIQVAYQAVIDGQGNDFSQQAAGLSSSGAQVAWLYMAPTPAAKLANQSKSAGYPGIFFANSISWNFDLIFATGPTAFRGSKAFSPWPALNDQRTQTYQQAYRRYYSDPPLDLGIPGWGLGQVVASAIRNAGRELGQNGFREAMQNLQLGRTGLADGTPLLWSPIAFRPGVREGGPMVVTYTEQNGNWTQESDYRANY
ncbi:MAG TPA: ABC transporter substrate-binding protein [Mycobacteriales bacterium]|nr:ABC transporter substrate-binding protein [Mycobacteriales bacterium]